MRVFFLHQTLPRHQLHGHFAGGGGGLRSASFRNFRNFRNCSATAFACPPCVRVGALCPLCRSVAPHWFGSWGGKCLHCLSTDRGERGSAGLLLSRRGEGGRGFWTQNLVYQKWPDQIFPIVNFVFSHYGHFGLGRGGGGFGGGPPPLWFLIILKKPWGSGRGEWDSRPSALCPLLSVVSTLRHPPTHPPTHPPPPPPSHGPSTEHTPGVVPPGPWSKPDQVPNYPHPPLS